MDATPIDIFTAAIGTLTAAGVLFLAYDVRALNRKFDRLEGTRQRGGNSAERARERTRAPRDPVGRQAGHSSAASDQPRPIVAWDLEEREEETILPDGDSYEISADGKKLLVSNERSWAIVDVAPGQTLQDRLATNALTMTLDPAAEWRQMFDEV